MWGFLPHTVGEILTYMIRDGVSMIFYVNIIHHIPLFRVSQPFCHECLLADFPIRNRPGLAVETYAYLNKMSAGGLIWYHIATLINLTQSLIGTFVYLQFEDIHRVRHIHHGICPTDSTLHLCLDIYVQETEHKIEYGLEMLLRMVLKVVGDGCHIDAHTLQCLIYITAEHSLAETKEESIIVGAARIQIMRSP